MKKRGVIFLIAALLSPVLGMLLFGVVRLIGKIEIIMRALAIALAYTNPDGPFTVFSWAIECVLFTCFLFVCAFPVLLYSAILRFATPRAEKVYLIPKFSALTMGFSASGAALLMGINELIDTISITNDLEKYPHRMAGLYILITASGIALLLLAIIYICKWRKATDADGNKLPLRLIFLDTLRALIAVPGFFLICNIGYNILLILFSNARYLY